MRHDPDTFYLLWVPMALKQDESERERQSIRDDLLANTDEIVKILEQLNAFFRDEGEEWKPD